jgi:hypothetical protein
LLAIEHASGDPAADVATARVVAGDVHRAIGECWEATSEYRAAVQVLG